MGRASPDREKKYPRWWLRLRVWPPDFIPIWGKGTLRKLQEEGTAWTTPTSLESHGTLRLSIHFYESQGRPSDFSLHTAAGGAHGTVLGSVVHKQKLFSGIFREGSDNWKLLFLPFPNCYMQPAIGISRLELQQPFWKYTTVQHAQNDLCAGICCSITYDSKLL